MKKIFIIPAMFVLSLLLYASCPIDAGETVCALPGLREKVEPIYKESQSATPYPNATLQPLNRQDPIEQMRGPNNNLNYNSGCQFGVCLQNPNQTSLPGEK